MGADRSLIIGAVAAVLVWAINIVGRSYGIEVTPEVATAMPILIGFVVSYFVPPTTKDLVKQIDDNVVKAAQMDPNSSVSYIIPPVTPPTDKP